MVTQRPVTSRTFRTTHALLAVLAATALVAPALPLFAEPPTPAQAVPATGDAIKKADALLAKGAGFLLKSQQANGAFVPEQAPVAMNALALRALVLSPGYSYATPAIRRGYDNLLAFQAESGGIYKSSLANYNTAIAISALAAANSPDLKAAIDKAVNYLKTLQWTDTIAGPQGEKIDPKNPWYGGWGYGGTSRGGARPDLSNAQLALDALHDSGLPADDPAFKAAQTFLTRLQNNSETNDQAWAGDDGGFVYGPSDTGKGESFAGEYADANGRRLLRSYGSMTYAGLKSMVYAGISKDDPRVKAAWNWVRNNWTLEENPGLKAADPAKARYALYYYYLTLARALRAYGSPVIIDAQGKPHDWRLELIDKLASLQQENGSWSGEKKWMEDNPILVTSYSMLALQEATASLEGKP